MMGNDAHPIRVLIVDDNVFVRMGLAILVENFDDLELIGEADGGRQAVDLTDRLGPDVVIMDLHMPDLDGVSAIREIRATDLETKILVLTNAIDPDQLQAAIHAGANGLLPKTITIDDLANAIYGLF